MAGKDHRTEKPTAKRRGEARKKGQVAKSPDLNTALVLTAGLIALSAMGPSIASGTGNAMRYAFALIAHPAEVSSAAGLKGVFELVLQTMLATVAPIAGICLAVGVLANVAQVGLRPSLTRLKPDIKRINPGAGAKNLFGPRLLFETGKSLTKVAVIGAVTAIALVPQLTNLGASIDTPPAALGELVSSSSISIAQRAAIAFLLIAIVDLIYQRRKFQRSLKMTKQEVKDEVKQYASPPEVRSVLRRRQMQLARARMMAAVPQADVVVTNPTHYAAALSYDGTKPAPVLVAKGQGHVALQIRRIAQEHGVPVVPDPPLARALHSSLEIGEMIGQELYAAVAQVLAFVYRMAGRRKVAA